MKFDAIGLENGVELREINRNWRKKNFFWLKKNESREGEEIGGGGWPLSRDITTLG
jgi:hypothetical protein